MLAAALAPFGASLLVAYIFYALHMVTDGFFVPACAICCDWLHLPDDVAGATLLGAGLNAPELFGHAVSLAAGNPVGLGAITGSFNFNVLAIAGFTALLTPPKVRLQLEIRYVARDVCAYVVALGLLQWAVLDGMVTPFELGVLLGTYVLYVTVCLLTGQIARACCSERRGPRSNRTQRRRLRPTLAPAPDALLFPPVATTSDSMCVEGSGGLRQPLVSGMRRAAFDADSPALGKRKPSDGSEAGGSGGFGGGSGLGSAAGSGGVGGGQGSGGGLLPSVARRSFAQLSHAIAASTAAPGPVGRLARGLSTASLAVSGSISSALHTLDNDYDEGAWRRDAEAGAAAGAAGAGAGSDAEWRRAYFAAEAEAEAAAAAAAPGGAAGTGRRRLGAGGGTPAGSGARTGAGAAAQQQQQQQPQHGRLGGAGGGCCCGGAGGEAAEGREGGRQAAGAGGVGRGGSSGSLCGAGGAFGLAASSASGCSGAHGVGGGGGARGMGGGGMGGGLGGGLGRWSPLVTALGSDGEARAAYSAHVRAARRAGYNLRFAATPSSIGLDRMLLSSGGGGGGLAAGAAGGGGLGGGWWDQPGEVRGGWGSRVSAAGSAASEGADSRAGDGAWREREGEEEAEAAARGSRSWASGCSGAGGWRGPLTCPPSVCGSCASSMDAVADALGAGGDGGGGGAGGWQGPAGPAAGKGAGAGAGAGAGQAGGLDLGELPPVGFGAEEEPEPPLSERLLEWPHGGTCAQKAWAVLNLPLALSLYLLFPSARAMARGWFPLAMGTSVLLLALLSYSMSLLCDFIAAAWGIPAELIGSTVVAIGTSLPNVFAAVAVGRAGKADMAVCQAFGSNAFDVFVAFALPLTVKSIALGGAPLVVEAPTLSTDVTVDLIFVLLFLGLVGLYRGRMRPSLGICALCLYLCWFTTNLISVYAQALDRLLRANGWR